jgi:hypothetical protein
MTSEKQIEANSLATRSPSPAVPVPRRVRGRGLGRGCLPPKSARTNPNIPRQSAKSTQTRTHSKPIYVPSRPIESLVTYPKAAHCERFGE